MLFRSSSRGLGYGYTPGGGATQIEEFARSSKLKQFLASYFSYTEIAPTQIRWKPPFWLIRREIRVFEDMTPDPRSGGFGPLYGTALVLGWVALGVACWSPGFRPAWHEWFLAVAVLVTSFPSQVWWARWVPQLSLLALAPLLILFGNGRSVSQAPRGFGILTALTLVVNSGIILLYYSLGMIRTEKILRAQFAILESLPQPLALQVGIARQNNNDTEPVVRFMANRFWLEDAGIRTELVANKPPRPCMKIVKTTSWVGLPKDWRKKAADSSLVSILRKKELLEE